MLVQPDLTSAINLQAANDFKEGTYEKKVKELILKNKEKKWYWFIINTMYLNSKNLKIKEINVKCLK